MIKRNKFLFTFIICAFLGIATTIYSTNIECGYYQYIRSTIKTGGSLYFGGEAYVEDGQITQVGIDACHNEGISDEEIASWSGASSAAEDYSNSTSNNNNSVTDENSVEDNNSSSSSTTTQSQNASNSQYTDEEIEAAWEETNRRESTCTESGYIEYTNSLTGKTKTEELPLAKHQYEESERVEPTCTEDGSVTYTCSVCGDTYDETISATGHSYEWVTTKEAGLFTDGLEEEVCSICGEKSGATHTLSAKIANSVVLLIICGIIIVTVGASSFILLHKRQAKNVLQSKKS